jgi:3-oxoadipate enol-lactonase
MTETIIKGDTFNVTAEGRPDAPAILFAHSLGTNLHVFDRQAAALSPHFHVIRFDARGHGGSHVSAGDYSIEQLGKDALAILDALKIEKAHFVGLSAGGLVGLWLLRHAPNRIERAVLANAAAQIASRDFWNERIRIVHENGIGALAPSIVENWFTRHYREQHPEEVHRAEQALAAMSGEGYAGGAAAVRDADFRAELAHIHHPVLVIVGKHDPVTPPGVGALVASSIPGAKIVTVEAAHLSPIEAAEAFNDAVAEFLLSAEAKPAAAETREAPPPKPRKPRVPKPKPAPVVEAAHEPHATAEPPPAKKPEHRPRLEHKAEPAKAPEPVAAPARKSPAKKSAARKAAAKKRTAKKSAAKKSSRKGALKKRVARKPVKKSVARKAAAKRRPIKKAVKKTGRKTAVKKSARKIAKRPVKKTAAKKSSRKRVTRRGRRR